MISVCIPTYGHNHSVYHYFQLLLDSILQQRDVEFEVVVSDNSKVDRIEKLCGDYAKKMRLLYVRNRETTGISNNTNHAISLASSDKIKIMYQDDLLIDKHALRHFDEALDNKMWVVAGYRGMDSDGQFRRKIDPVYPKDTMLQGRNTIGMPSVLGIRRNPFRFDPNLRTRLDCEYYLVLHGAYGEPEYIRKTLIGCRYWNGSMSRIQGECSQEERAYLNAKHPCAQVTDTA